MKTKVAIGILFLLVLVVPMFAQQTDNVQRGVEGVRLIQTGPYAPPAMLRLQGVYVNKPDKQGQSALCFQYGDTQWYWLFIFRQNGSIQFLGELDLRVAGPKHQLAFIACREGIRIADITNDVLTAINPALVQPAAIQSPADRQKLIDGLNAGFKQMNLAAYVEAVGSILTIHSERANNIRFHQTILNWNKDTLDLMKRAGIATVVYTNDADQKFIFDVTTGQEVKP